MSKLSQQAEKSPTLKPAVTYCIHQGYDGSTPSFVSSSVPPNRQAIYCQLLAEQMFGPTASISALGIACALVAFYGCEPAEPSIDAVLINLRDGRSELIGNAVNRHKYLELMADPALYVEGLVEALKPHNQKEPVHG